MATLIKHTSGIYFAQFYDRNRRPARKRLSLRTRNKRTAERLLTRLEADYFVGSYDPWKSSKQEPETIGSDIYLLGGAVDAYMGSCGHLSKHTLRTYRSIFHLFRDHLGSSYEVSRIKPREILSFLDSTEANEVTRHKYVNHLGYLCRFLVQRGVLASDLSKEVKLPKLPEQAPKGMTLADVDHLVATILNYSEENKDCWRIPDYSWLA